METRREIKLNLARIDKDAIRDNLYKNGLKIIGVAVSFVLAITIFISVKFLSFTNPLFWLLPIGGSTLTFALIWKIIKNNTPNIDIGKFLVQPEYKKDMGYLYQVEQDLKNVFKLLVHEDKPAVIFIDDLDRCSPVITAEIVEAINLFISSSDLKSYFVLGQDAQMVAAALDVAYEKIGAKITDNKRTHGSLGWAFMEKFVQLQFPIPAITDKQRDNMMTDLLSAQKTEAGELLINNKITELKEKIQTAPDTNALLSQDIIQLKAELKTAAPEAVFSANEKIIERAAAEFTDNSAEVQNLIDSLSRYLGNSPRTIKRFINLYRFYRFINISRVNQDTPVIDNITLGRWLIVMIRWPQLIRSCQWNENDFLNGATAVEKAKEFNRLINQCANYEDWDELLSAKEWKIDWLRDHELFEYIKTIDKDNSLEKAFEMNIF